MLRLLAFFAKEIFINYLFLLLQSSKIYASNYQLAACHFELPMVGCLSSTWKKKHGFPKGRKWGKRWRNEVMERFSRRVPISQRRNHVHYDRWGPTLTHVTNITYVLANLKVFGIKKLYVNFADGEKLAYRKKLGV